MKTIFKTAATHIGGQPHCQVEATVWILAALEVGLIVLTVYLLWLKVG